MRKHIVIVAAALLMSSVPLFAADVDLSIDVDASAEEVLSGSNITYTIDVTNDGSGGAGAFVVVNELPAETTFVSCSSTAEGVCGGSGTTRSISFSSLAAGATATITIVANVNCCIANETDLFDTAEVQPAGAKADGDEIVFDNDSVFVTVLNPPPKIINVAASPSSLWPANHKMTNVAVNYSIVDNCGPVRVTLSVASNEPINGLGDGDTAPDWQIVNTHLVQLRAERGGVGTGRTYTITITATDCAQQSSSATVTVTVPHDKK